MSEWQNDWFPGPYQNLSSSPVATCHHREALLKLIYCSLSKFSLHYLTASRPKIQLDFSWSLEMSEQQNDWFARPCESLSISPSAALHHQKALSKLILSKSMNIQSNHQKNLIITLIKLACFFKLFSNQRLEAFCQLVSWTFGMSDWQNDQFPIQIEGLSISPSTTLHYPEALSKLFEISFTIISLKVINF